MPDVDTRLFTVAEAAKQLRTSPTTMYRLVRDREINFRRVGKGRLLFTQEDLDAYIAATLRPAVTRGRQR
jgi:excisionase family DNA binding protein